MVRPRPPKSARAIFATWRSAVRVRSPHSLAKVPGQELALRPEGSTYSPTWFDQVQRARRCPPSVVRPSSTVSSVASSNWSTSYPMDSAAKDAEILVFRHQLAVLRRQAAPPRFTWSDQEPIALLAGLVPRDRWCSFLITPRTILHRHRSRVRRRWPHPHRRPGRPVLPDETVELICRLAPLTGQ